MIIVLFGIIPFFSVQIKFFKHDSIPSTTSLNIEYLAHITHCYFVCILLLLLNLSKRDPKLCCFSTFSSIFWIFCINFWENGSYLQNIVVSNKISLENIRLSMSWVVFVPFWKIDFPQCCYWDMKIAKILWTTQ